jgi:protein FAM50
LSFDLEEDEGDEEEFTISNKRAKTETESGSAPMKRLGKDPSVDTSFLPDKEREEREAQERERLKREWLIEQERIKSSELKVACSYYDGLAHRTHVTGKTRTPHSVSSLFSLNEHTSSDAWHDNRTVLGDCAARIH